MTDHDAPARTFVFEMRDIPVLQVALEAVSDPPEGANAMAGIDLGAMATDVMTALLDGYLQSLGREFDTPFPPADGPRIEVDLDRAEAVALARVVLAVRQTTDGPLDALLLQTMAQFYPQLPEAWVGDAGALARAVEAVRAQTDTTDGQ